MGEAGGTVTPAPVSEPTVTVLAPAKLTLSLRVTGVRAGRLPPARAEMVTLEPGRRARPHRGRPRVWPSVAEPGTRAGGLGDPGDNLISRALVACGRVASVHLTKRIPLGGGLGGGSADAAAVLRWAGVRRPRRWRRALGADVPFCVVGRPGPGRRRGRSRHAAALRASRTTCCVLPPFGVDTARCTGPGTSGHRERRPRRRTR